MLKNKTILLTGATGKIGRKLAVGFASHGCTLVLPVRQLDVNLTEQCMSAGANNVIMIPIDLTSELASVELQSEVLSRGCSPNILVNNARNVDYLQSDKKGVVKRTNWLDEFLLDVVVPYELTQAFLDSSDIKLEKIINIASIYGVTAPNLRLYENPLKESPINYGVCKSGLIHLTKELAVRLAPQGIAVNVVSFGGVIGRVNEVFKQSYATLCPAGRMLSEEDVFGPVKFLASADSMSITGHNLIVDGGWTIW